MRALRELAEVERAASRDAFQRALGMPWDIIMLDFSLPQLHGDEALKLALERAPQTPIIVFSGTITVTKAVEVIKAGATDYVEKGTGNCCPSPCNARIGSARTSCNCSAPSGWKTSARSPPASSTI